MAFKLKGVCLQCAETHFRRNYILGCIHPYLERQPSVLEVLSPMRNGAFCIFFSYESLVNAPNIDTIYTGRFTVTFLPCSEMGCQNYAMRIIAGALWPEAMASKSTYERWKWNAFYYDSRRRTAPVWEALGVRCHVLLLFSAPNGFERFRVRRDHLIQNLGTLG